MAKSKVVRVKYFTPERIALINPDNLVLYEKYLMSNIIKNKDVEQTTFKTYKNSMQQFLVYLAEKWNNIGLYSPEFFESAVDIMEGFMAFCVNTLKNNKKVINTKVSSVSTFYLWSMKRKLVDRHPFDKKLDRMKGASEEKIINSYFLTDEQVTEIRRGLLTDKKYDIQDQLIFELFLDSANRVGALDKITLSSMDLENMVFNDIREKRGYKVEVAFSEATKDIIKEWLEMRKDMDNLDIDAIFLTRYNGKWNKMTYGTIQDRIKRIGYIIGLEDFHCHCMRKTKLNDIYVKTGDLALAAEYGNHKSTETTRQSYIKPKSKTEIRAKINEMMQKNNEIKVEIVDEPIEIPTESSSEENL